MLLISWLSSASAAPPIVDLSAGHQRTCAVRASGEVLCWGGGDPRPVVVPGLDDATRVSVGHEACAVRRSGAVTCWTRPDEPADVPGISDARDVSVYGSELYHETVCVLRRGGRAACWTDDYDLPGSHVVHPIRGAYGLVALVADEGLGRAIDGNGDEWTFSSDGTGLRELASAPGMVRISGEVGERCGVLSSGTVQCSSPLGGIQRAVDVSVSQTTRFGCILRETGAVACWGRGDRGQLGDGSTIGRSQPVEVVGLHDAVQVTAGADHACARTASGGAVCWGANDAGQLGTSTRVQRATPAPVVGVTDAIGLAVGTSHACALRATGEIECWGADDRGQLGDGIREARGTPRPATGLPPAVALAGRGDLTCAQTIDGLVVCAGPDPDGKLQLDSVPWQLEIPQGPARLAVGEDVVCAIPAASGDAGCRGRWPDELGLEALGPAASIAASGSLLCLVTPEGELRCAGDALERRFPDDRQRTLPLHRFGGPPAPLDVDVDSRYLCAVESGGSVECFGDNPSGVLGFPRSQRWEQWPEADGPGEVRAVPGVHDALAVAVGPDHACALTEDGVVCWGANEHGQLGRPASAEGAPAPVEVGCPVAEVGAGDGFGCARCATGEVRCWGRDDLGQLGSGTMGVQTTPVAVEALAGP